MLRFSNNAGSFVSIYFNLLGIVSQKFAWKLAGLIILV